MRLRFCHAVALAAGLVLSARCAVEKPLSTRVHLRIDGDGQRVQITTATELKQSWEVGGAKDRLASAREAMLAARDEWSNRYAQLEAQSDRLLQQRERGELRRVERSAVVERDQLTRFFADTPLTFQFTGGADFSELLIFTGSSSRATRQQKDNVERFLGLWSEDGAHYVRAVGKVYEYLERRPDRAGAAFAVLLEGDERPAENEEEETLLAEARASMKQILDRLDTAQENASTVDEDFDDVFNPFPAAVTVQLPGTIVAVENFVRLGDDSVEVRGAGITDAVRTLEGRWVSPDPLAILVRSALDGEDQAVTAASLAAMPRKRSAPVTPSEVREAIVQGLQRAKMYRVQWR
ncbi:MAG TPA: hypothetical protein VEO54_10895 [Thermoanaerobaculia bacterium]|nr:hypothetical protein [Thermoanaerobaculia bacterium]